MALGQTCCKRNNNGTEPSHLKDIQYNVNIRELSWNIQNEPKWKMNTQEQQDKFRCTLCGEQVLSLHWDYKTCSSCQQPSQEYHKTWTALVSSLYKTPQNLHNCQQPFQEYHKTWTVHQQPLQEHHKTWTALVSNLLSHILHARQENVCTFSIYSRSCILGQKRSHGKVSRLPCTTPRIWSWMAEWAKLVT